MKESESKQKEEGRRKHPDKRRKGKKTHTKQNLKKRSDRFGIFWREIKFSPIFHQTVRVQTVNYCTDFIIISTAIDDSILFMKQSSNASVF